jgi:hypothetical protein
MNSSGQRLRRGAAVGSERPTDAGADAVVVDV